MRKVKQLVVVNDTEHQQGCFMAVCEDGTLWNRSYKYAGPDGGNIGDPKLYALMWEQVDGPPEELQRVEEGWSATHHQREQQ